MPTRLTRPCRELSSCLFDFKCSCSCLMRLSKIAICTSGEPVSPGCVANSSIISVFSATDNDIFILLECKVAQKPSRRMRRASEQCGIISDTPDPCHICFRRGIRSTYGSIRPTCSTPVQAGCRYFAKAQRGEALRGFNALAHFHVNRDNIQALGIRPTSLQYGIGR